MARTLEARLCISGVLKALDSVHVGGAEESAISDLPLARDGRGRICIRGTSVVGRLRRWCRAAGLDQDTENLVFGFQEEGTDAGAASLLYGDDAALESEESVFKEVRDGVGIDRFSASAAERFKYDREVLARDTEIPVALEVEVPAGEDGPRIRAVVGHLLQALVDGQIALGAGETGGLGRVQLGEESLRIVEEGLDGREAILRILEGCCETRAIADLLAADPSLELRGPGRVELRLGWQPLDTVLVQSGRPGVGIDVLPMMAEGAQVRPLIPGRSIRGVLRSTAERIVRTLLANDDPWSAATRPDFLDQVNVPLVDWLFGLPGDSAAGKESEPLQCGRGAVRVSDCLGRSIPREAWREIEAVPEFEDTRHRLDQHGLSDWEPAMRVAVDRWTSAPASGKLFSALEPVGEEWEDIRVEVDLTRLPADEARPALALLFLTLRQLAEGRATLGAGGRGEIEIAELDLAVAGAVPEGLPEPGSISGSAWSSAPESWRRLEDDWCRWIDEQAPLKEAS